MLHFLLLAQMRAVIRQLATALLLLPRRILAPLERTLRRIAARALKEQLKAVAATESTNWSSVSCHGSDNRLWPRSIASECRVCRPQTGRLEFLTYYTRRFLRGRQPLCGNGVMSSIDLTFRPAASSEVIALSRPLPGPF